MKHYLCLLLSLCLFFKVFSQKINDSNSVIHQDASYPKATGAALANVINYPSATLQLAHFKGKLVIIDFWASYCKPCLLLLPEYQKLQKAMGDRVQFVLVTRENSKVATSTLSRLHINLPCVTDDKLLAAEFPHTSIPHEVWLLNGKVIATTFGEEVDEASISRVLKGGSVKEQKNDNLAFDALAPLLVNGNGGKGEVFYQSIITPYIAGLNSVLGFRKDSSRIISFGLNLSVLRLYEQAFSHYDPLLEQENRFVLLLPDSMLNVISRYSPSAYHEWIKANGFCYDLVLPAGFKGDITTQMVDDLNRFFVTRFGICAYLEKREEDCLVLSRVPGSTLANTPGEPKLNISSGLYSQQNLPVSNLVMQLAEQFRRLNTPVIDDTGYKHPVNITLSADLSKLADVQQALRICGLNLRIEKRSIPMVVIRPVPTNTTP
jgi:thiol-disulfide isomerase/thioredoxin